MKNDKNIDKKMRKSILTTSIALMSLSSVAWGLDYTGEGSAPRFNRKCQTRDAMKLETDNFAIKLGIKAKLPWTREYRALQDRKRKVARGMNVLVVENRNSWPLKITLFDPEAVANSRHLGTVPAYGVSRFEINRDDLPCPHKGYGIHGKLSPSGLNSSFEGLLSTKLFSRIVFERNVTGTTAVPGELE